MKRTQKQEIREALEDGDMTLDGLYFMTGIKKQVLDQVLRKMIRSGTIEKIVIPTIYRIKNENEERQGD